MTTQSWWRAGAVAFVMLAFALIGGAHLCDVALKTGVDPGMKPIGRGALACTEFWLNRYQTLLGAAAALVAGYAAYSGALKQVARADKQIEILNNQVAIDRVEYINARLASIDALYESMTRLHISCSSAIIRAQLVRDVSATILKSIDEKTDIYKDLHEVDYRNRVNYFNHDVAQVRDFIKKIAASERDSTLPANVRTSLIDFRNQYVEILVLLTVLRQKLADNIEVQFPGRDTIKAAHERISGDKMIIPNPLVLVGSEAYDLVIRRRGDLMRLRQVAEKVAEI